MAQLSLVDRPVPGGPVAVRQRLLRWGPLMGLVLPAVVFAVGIALSRVWPCDGSACWRKGEVGFLLRELAVPALVMVGFPLEGGDIRLASAVAVSTVLWLGIGAWAARRAVRSPMASWRHWWREYLVLLFAVWGGVGLALLVISRLDI